MDNWDRLEDLLKGASVDEAASEDFRTLVLTFIDEARESGRDEGFDAGYAYAKCLFKE